MAKTGCSVTTLFERSAAIFMHRPYHRMPQTALAGIYLWSLGLSEDAEERECFRVFCEEADVLPEAVLGELRSDIPLWKQAQEAETVRELYPLTMKVSKAFRKTSVFEEEILPKLSTGARTMMTFGNLYSAALPAWLAVGLEEAAGEELDWAGRELLLIGYGSGDTAEAMLVRVAPHWREAAESIGVDRALIDPIDLSRADYEALHDRHQLHESAGSRQGSFRIDRVGGSADGDFQDLGVEYYRYQPGRR
jgi:hydroxymethylglutaryl-CoA synthase